MEPNVDQLCNSAPRSSQIFFTSNPLVSNSTAYLYSVSQWTDGQFTLAPTSAIIPGRLRVADVDMDGFPDVAMTLIFTNFTTQTVILNNFDGN